MALEQRIGQKTYAREARRVPHAIGGHGVLPLQYVQPWKNDMKNRKLIKQASVLACLLDCLVISCLFARLFGYQLRVSMYFKLWKNDINRKLRIQTSLIVCLLVG